MPPATRRSTHGRGSRYQLQLAMLVGIPLGALSPHQTTDPQPSCRYVVTEPLHPLRLANRRLVALLPSSLLSQRGAVTMVGSVTLVSGAAQRDVIGVRIDAGGTARLLTYDPSVGPMIAPRVIASGVAGAAVVYPKGGAGAGVTAPFTLGVLELRDTVFHVIGDGPALDDADWLTFGASTIHETGAPLVLSLRGRFTDHVLLIRHVVGQSRPRIDSIRVERLLATRQPRILLHPRDTIIALTAYYGLSSKRTPATLAARVRGGALPEGEYQELVRLTRFTPRTMGAASSHGSSLLVWHDPNSQDAPRFLYSPRPTAAFIEDSLPGPVEEITEPVALDGGVFLVVVRRPDGFVDFVEVSGSGKRVVLRMPSRATEFRLVALSAGDVRLIAMERSRPDDMAQEFQSMTMRLGRRCQINRR